MIWVTINYIPWIKLLLLIVIGRLREPQRDLNWKILNLTKSALILDLNLCRNRYFTLRGEMFSFSKMWLFLILHALMRYSFKIIASVLWKGKPFLKNSNLIKSSVSKPTKLGAKISKKWKAVSLIGHYQTMWHGFWFNLAPLTFQICSYINS